MIQIENLTKKYGADTVLDIPQLEIPKAECFGLVGNNGAGKTTMFRLILDLIKATTGKVTIDGRDVKEDELWKSYVGSYLDEHMLLTFLTPDEYFATLAKMYGLSDQDLENHKNRFEVLFNGEVLGRKKYIRDLSKGNIKKVGIASAFMGNPQVVMLDEPFENLDPTSQNRLKRLILDELKERSTSFLLSSHDLAHVTDICDRIVLLEAGKVIKDLKNEKQQMSAELAEYFNR